MRELLCENEKGTKQESTFLELIISICVEIDPLQIEVTFKRTNSHKEWVAQHTHRLFLYIMMADTSKILFHQVKQIK